MAKSWHQKHISTKWGIAIIIFLLVSLGLLVSILNQSQDARSRATGNDNYIGCTVNGSNGQRPGRCVGLDLPHSPNNSCDPSRSSLYLYNDQVIKCPQKYQNCCVDKPKPILQAKPKICLNTTKFSMKVGGAAEIPIYINLNLGNTGKLTKDPYSKEVTDAQKQYKISSINFELNFNTSYFDNFVFNKTSGFRIKSIKRIGSRTLLTVEPTNLNKVFYGNTKVTIGRVRMTAKSPTTKDEYGKYMYNNLFNIASGGNSYVTNKPKVELKVLDGGSLTPLTISFEHNDCMDANVKIEPKPTKPTPTRSWGQGFTE